MAGTELINAAAKTVIEAQCGSLAFWHNLAQQPAALPILKQLLHTEVLRNGNFAYCIVAAGLAKSLTTTTKRCSSEAQPNTRLRSSKRRRITAKRLPLQVERYHIKGLLSDFLPIGIHMNGLVLSCLTLRDRVQLARVSQSSKQTLEHSCCWDPLYLDRLDCQALLRHLKYLCPKWYTRTKLREGSLPGGLLKVTKITAELMEPEPKLIAPDSESDSDAPDRSPISDPLDEMCKRLMSHFKMVKEFSLVDIKHWSFLSHGGFAFVRTCAFSQYGLVEFKCCASSPPTFVLHASRDAPPRFVEIDAAIDDNRSRCQRHVQYIETTTMSEHEALYLAENANVYKNGEHFFEIFTSPGDPELSTNAHTVRKYYKKIVPALRKQEMLCYKQA